MTLSPIIVMVYNRPYHTQRVLEALKKCKLSIESDLYIFSDAAKSEDQKSNVEKVRECINGFKGFKSIYIHHRESNFGLANSIISSVSKVVNTHGQAIIIEDDLIYSYSFLLYMNEALEKYRNHKHVFSVSAYTPSSLSRKIPIHYPYDAYFNYRNSSWGWASWRRAWQLYDFTISTYPEIKQKGYLDNYFSSYLEKKYRLSKTDKTIHGREVNWWDYQWDYTKFINSGLSIIPNKNLVTNLGFGGDATHTKSSKDIRGKNTAKELEFPLKHLPFVIRDRASDKRYFNKFILNVILMRKIFGFLGVRGYSTEG